MHVHVHLHVSEPNITFQLYVHATILNFAWSKRFHVHVHVHVYTLNCYVVEKLD